MLKHTDSLIILDYFPVCIKIIFLTCTLISTL